MKFNQTNNNHGGDVNNIIAEGGNAVQSTGKGAQVEVDKPKSDLWSGLWAIIAGALGWSKKA